MISRPQTVNMLSRTLAELNAIINTTVIHDPIRETMVIPKSPFKSPPMNIDGKPVSSSNPSTETTTALKIAPPDITNHEPTLKLITQQAPQRQQALEQFVARLQALQVKQQLAQEYQQTLERQQMAKQPLQSQQMQRQKEQVQSHPHVPARNNKPTEKIDHFLEIDHLTYTTNEISSFLQNESILAIANLPIEKPQPLKNAPIDEKPEENFSTFQLQPENFEIEKVIPSPVFQIQQPHQQKHSQNWIPADQQIEVNGFIIKGGMIYVRNKPVPQRLNDDPSLIVASLNVYRHYVDETQRLMGYWPRYQDISPEARRAYLQWLANGRLNPATDIGYVFLFFYGLEYRALIEINSDPTAVQEIDNIVREVKRLLSIYGHNNSFRRYASYFINFITANHLHEKSYLNSPPTTIGSSYELPYSYRIALGQLAKDKQPLPVDWALAWVLVDANINKRTPVHRFPEIFANLFKINYQKKYKSGFTLPRNQTKLRAYYLAASSAFSGRVSKYFGDIPDVTVISGSTKKLQEIVDQTTQALDSYSRYIGRNPDSKDLKAALLLLPFDIWPVDIQTSLQNLQEKVSQNILLISFSSLLENFNNIEQMTRNQIIDVAKVLENLEIGMEPDVLAGAKAPKAEDLVALFKCQHNPTETRSTPDYHAASVTLDLASAVAMADGLACEAEINMLHRQIESWRHLSPMQHARLKASLQLQIRQPSPLTNLKKKLDPLSLENKHSIARLLAHLAQADGHVSPEEVKLLERIYSALQLDKQLVYRDLHSSPISSNITQEKSSLLTDKTKVSSFNLDPERIAMLQKETDLVSTLLANVFVEDIIENEQLNTAVIEDVRKEESSLSATLLGLDLDHSSFLRHLLAQDQWSRAELLDLAVDLDLMLDGALENINEASLDIFDDTIFEGADPVELNQELVGKLTT